ncbi:hypothetical protein QWJ34_21045 [Saccharibacillus sp. CPCC 101409]|uniref:DUF6892 domain-containing protein n=1 Tax=Saccharibacillus sp. CPCC 101409 TaxID=3058041 RepID=UPI0026721B87|nr:hypothetical protein [Saccharibacillus sp. CPCC 101409]MDO3412264.1 hypothetical protein [Saccharibacillus sp. CPCC 101409]
MGKLQALLQANPDEEPLELSQRLLNRLQSFMPEQAGHALIEASFEWVDDFGLDDETNRRIDDRINEAWSTFALLTPEDRVWFYETILTYLEREPFVEPEKARQSAKLAELFALRKASLESSYALRSELRLQHPRLLELLKNWIDRGAQTAPDSPGFPGLSRAAAALFEVYFNHPHYMDDDDLRAEAAGLLPALIRIFYADCNHIHVYMLGYHGDYARETALLIDFYVKLDRPREKKGAAYLSLASSFMGEGAAALERGVVPVLDVLGRLMKGWTDEEFDEFLDTFVYYPLLHQPLLQIARSTERRMVLDLAVRQQRRTSRAEEAACTLEEANRIIAQIEAERMPSGEGGVRFADFNFKLAVIEELMYKQQVLRPRFDVGVFVQEYVLREISIAEEGDCPIPEVREYFERLVLTEQDLARVTKLVIAGGQQVQLQIVPFWNGEDGMFDVHSLEDLKHLPNLRVLQTIGLLKADAAPAVERGIILIQD